MTQATLALPAPERLDLGLPGEWLIGPIALRADAPCGPLDGVVWLEAVSDAQWRDLAALLWRADGSRRPSAGMGHWYDDRDRIVAPCGAHVVTLAGWLAPVVCMPGGSCRRVEVAGVGYVLVSVAGDVVAMIREIPAERTVDRLAREVGR